ncbi:MULTISPECIES: response regulator transcription factor [Clostridium]|jgi:Response regulators consisting of a CheY-like receiver domain and a winged-helix DNA-binding domain|uniref:Stage 0 sporulation protein A homolog n=2 Tax=Clostridium beijerinckii TaxID=1520 RepID=A0A1S8RYF2_CLOBE|nr:MULTISPECIES: response regulator transcription factor [Clostridium]ABR35124.1 two component transcriptional regulator, winged helix family [Clostridium beijerinckii NCIMB 8052]AIU03722.1 two component transcriptional regulator [Clostridium beijerinckii ATCC 35702]MBF7810243.1 response regulator transcription factor [Clostridium beijerinckii]NOW90886.1 DNA-binding response OmpR family regulator [Clostridium beijerinckii]NRT23486.1 DNA-binding response OmpR family regulator [Clostridium beije
MNNILIIEDEKSVSDVVKAYLEREGYGVYSTENGLDGIEVFRKERIDLVILDLMLPDIDGEEVCKILRKISDVYIFMLTAKSTLSDKIEGLNIGADEYLTKPLSPRELTARVNALFRRVGCKKENVISFNDNKLIIDVDKRLVKLSGEEINLTPNEFDILYILASNQGKVFTREAIIERAFGMEFDGSDRSIDVHIKNLRKKIEEDTKSPQYIVTVTKIGYKFGDKL